MGWARVLPASQNLLVASSGTSWGATGPPSHRQVSSKSDHAVASPWTPGGQAPGLCPPSCPGSPPSSRQLSHLPGQDSQSSIPARRPTSLRPCCRWGCTPFRRWAWHPTVRRAEGKQTPGCTCGPRLSVGFSALAPLSNVRSPVPGGGPGPEAEGMTPGVLATHMHTHTRPSV